MPCRFGVLLCFSLAWGVVWASANRGSGTIRLWGSGFGVSGRVLMWTQRSPEFEVCISCMSSWGGTNHNLALIRLSGVDHTNTKSIFVPIAHMHKASAHRRV